jgi:hypothetical protein
LHPSYKNSTFHLYIQGIQQTLLSKVTDNKYISQKKTWLTYMIDKPQAIDVATFAVVWGKNPEAFHLLFIETVVITISLPMFL